MDLVTEPELDNVGKCNVSTGACPDLRASPGQSRVIACTISQSEDRIVKA